MQIKGKESKNTTTPDKDKGGKANCGKCYVCGNIHYPFCKRPCRICGKVHFPYCTKDPKIKKEQTTHIVVKEESEGKSPEKGHASIAAAVDARLK